MKAYRLTAMCNNKKVYAAIMINNITHEARLDWSLKEIDSLLYPTFEIVRDNYYNMPGEDLMIDYAIETVEIDVLLSEKL